MDDEDQPVNAEIGSATQVVDFAATGEVAQNGNVPACEVASELQEQAQSLPVDSHMTSGPPENREGSQPSDNPIAPIHTHAGVTPSVQDINTEALPNELRTTSGISNGGEARLNSDDEVPPHELPPGEKGKDAEVTVLPGGPTSREEEAETRSSPVGLRRVPSPMSSIIERPTESRAPRKRRLPVGILQWRFGDTPGRKVVESKKIGLKQDDQKKDSKTDDQKNDIQKKEQKKDGQKREDAKEPEVGQKALGGTERRETEKAPVPDPWETLCELKIIPPVPATMTKSLAVDIVAIHDLDETPDTAWTFIPEAPAQKSLKNLKDNDTESRRSRPSIERYQKQLEAKQTRPDLSKKRRGSTKDDDTPGFTKDGRITEEGRIHKVEGWEVPVTIDDNDAATQEVLPSQAGPSNVSLPPPPDEPRTVTTSSAGPSPNEPETMATVFGGEKKEAVELEPKRAKGSKKKKKAKAVSSITVPTSGPPPSLPPPPQAPGTTPPQPTQLDSGVDGRRESKEMDDGRASEKDQRSGRQSTDIDGSERKRRVHLFQDPTMIPGTFPGARILSFTYPKMSAATAHEYLDKAAYKLLVSLIEARSKQPCNSVPIIFIASGFGGLVLQKLFVLAADTHDEKETDSAQVLNMTAGVLLLDTPFPATQKDGKIETPAFPSIPNARQDHILRRLNDSGNKLDISDLWDKFDPIRQVQDRKLPIVWLHTLIAKEASSASKLQPKRPLATLAQHSIFCMAMASDSTKRGLSRFSNSKDPIYSRLVGQMRRCLLFIASEREELEHLLRDLVELPDMREAVDVEDEHGRSALHCAASSPNHAAVTVLVKKGDADVLHQDNRGQTPLHSAIRKAVEQKPIDKDDQKPFKTIIERLMESGADIFQADKEGKHPWAYADDIQWLKDLKDNRDMFSGPSTSDGVYSLDPLARPEMTQLKVCEKVRGDLVEFYTISSEHKTEERRNSERSYLLDMIYDLDPRTILERSRPRLTKGREVLQCRWLHVPANNERWIQDLFLALKIKDTSIVGQHEGSSRHTLHMVAQATKYKQVCERHYWENGLEDHTVSSKSSGTNTARGATDLKPVTKTVTMDRDAIVLFMPVLAYEPSVLRREMSKAVRKLLRGKELEGEEKNHDFLLLKAYLDNTETTSLHCRRTLDQFSYYMLDTTEKRDRDQVLHKWGRKKLEKLGKQELAPVLMVDQLWLWILHDGTVISSFPNAWDHKQTHGLKAKLDEEIKRNKQRDPIRSVDHLVNLIIKLSIDFLRRDGPGGIRFQEAFQSSINNIAEREAEQFKRFKALTKKLSMKTPTEDQRIAITQKLLSTETLTEAQRTALTERLNARTLTEAQRTKNIEQLFQLNVETHLLVEIKDIQDELNIIASILGQQRDVLKRLHKICSMDESTDADSPTLEKSKGKGGLDVDSVAGKSGDHPDTADRTKHKSILHHDVEKEEELLQGKKRENRVHFVLPEKESKDAEKDAPILTNRSLVDDNLAIVMGNIRVVADMQDYAATVHTSINSLLDLKQRQANAWEARFSREGSQQSQRQGNIMLVFTLVTIVFLPLSFMSSFFALSVNTFPKDEKSGNTSWPLHTLSLLLFGISTLVFIPLVIIALYVNQITSFTKETFRSFVLREKKSTDDPEDKEVEEDIDDYSVKDEDESDDEDDHSTKAAESDDDIIETFSEESSSVYAPIFGKWKFHTRIPIFRKLWERRRYLNTRDDDSDYLSNEDVEKDYPLHHFLSAISLGNIIPLRLYVWWWNLKGHNDSDDDSDDDSSLPSWMVERVPRRTRRSTIIVEEFRRPHVRGPWRSSRRSSDSDGIIEIIEEDSDLPRSRVSRAFRPVERIFRRRDKGEEDSSSSDDIVEVIEEESDLPRSRASRVFRPVERLFRRRDRDQEEAYSDETRSSDREVREAGSTSGSDRQEGASGGLGAALPAPLRRLFIRRRRIHDVESGFEDD